MNSNNIKQLFTQYKMLALLIAVALIWGFFSWKTEGGFTTPRNLSNLMRQMAITGILACGMVARHHRRRDRPVGRLAARPARGRGGGAGRVAPPAAALSNLRSCWPSACCSACSTAT
jgi:hypothetical protein